MRVSLIAAVSSNGVIGINGTLPWYIPKDLHWFRMHTTNGICIMGRKTWDSLPTKPLKDRLNIIISREKHESDHKDVLWASSLREALNLAYSREMPNAYIIGGAEIFNQALLLRCVHHVYLTTVHTKITNRSARYLVLPKSKKRFWKSQTFRNNKYSWTFEMFKLCPKNQARSDVVLYDHFPLKYQ
jgi:dihydrofolate reductase